MAGKITKPVHCGAIAQLGERIVRNDEVVGSIPTSSTNLLNHLPRFPAGHRSDDELQSRSLPGYRDLGAFCNESGRGLCNRAGM